jgi:hypothetical protein
VILFSFLCVLVIFIGWRTVGKKESCSHVYRGAEADP